jgi:SAM-dependent methyltransferase
VRAHKVVRFEFLETSLDRRVAETIAHYDVHAEDYGHATRDSDLGLAYATFLPRLNPDAHILDAGCGSGRDSRRFIERGFRVTAFDASEAMTRLAALHIGQPVLHLRFDEVTYQEVFDGVWACASLVHVAGDAFDDALGRLAGALRTGGVLYASLKRGNGDEVRDGRYFRYWTASDLAAAVERQSNLTLSHIWLSSDALQRTPGDWLNVLAVRRP